MPFEGLRVRGTISRDIRAANIQELFAPPSTGYANVRDPFRNNEFYATIPVPNGNANLQPEEADTKTLGIVYRPDFLPDFFISLDWYNIEIAGQIGGLAYQRTVDLCFQGQQEFCGLINRNSAGLIVTIGTPLLNIAQYETSGVDPEMGYEQPLDLFGLAGDLSLRFFATQRIKDETATGGGACPQDSASNQGQEVASVTATYKTGALSLSGQQNYVSGGRLSQTLPRFAGDRIKSRSFLDFTGGMTSTRSNGSDLFRTSWIGIHPCSRSRSGSPRPTECSTSWAAGTCWGSASTCEADARDPHS